MTYEHLVEKMQKEQAKFMPAIDQLEQDGKLPEDFARAVANVKEWDSVARVKLGAAEVAADAPNVDPVDAFSNALATYQGMFSEKEQEAMQLYREYAAELFNMVKGASISRA